MHRASNSKAETRAYIMSMTLAVAAEPPVSANTAGTGEVVKHRSTLLILEVAIKMFVVGVARVSEGTTFQASPEEVEEATRGETALPFLSSRELFDLFFTTHHLSCASSLGADTDALLTGP